jgi:hypothetical protein
MTALLDPAETTALLAYLKQNSSLPNDLATIASKLEASLPINRCFGILSPVSL